MNCSPSKKFGPLGTEKFFILSEKKKREREERLLERERFNSKEELLSEEWTIETAAHRLD